MLKGQICYNSRVHQHEGIETATCACKMNDNHYDQSIPCLMNLEVRSHLVCESCSRKDRMILDLSLIITVQLFLFSADFIFGDSQSCATLIAENCCTVIYFVFLPERFFVVKLILYKVVISLNSGMCYAPNSV